MKSLLNKYDSAPDKEHINNELLAALSAKEKFNNLTGMKQAFSLIDLTSLNVRDNENNITVLCQKLNDFHTYTRFIEIPHVAAFCLYPACLSIAHEHLNAREVRLVSVAGGFPTSQTFTEVKIAEAKMAVHSGAQEIDIVMPVGKFLQKNYQAVYNEIALIKQSIGNITLKVILETGLLNPQQIKDAAILALEAGADFIKTSTGKESIGATLEAVYIMSLAIREYHESNGRQAGIKPAGGINTFSQVVDYLAVISYILGENWLTANLCRFGASRLANAMLQDMHKEMTGKDSVIKYFSADY